MRGDRKHGPGLHYDSFMPRRPAGIALVLALVAFTSAVSVAQRFGVAEGAGAGIRVPPVDFQDGGFTICKWMFRSERSEPGGIGWSTDYPFGEINLLTRLSEMTKVRVSRDTARNVKAAELELPGLRGLAVSTDGAHAVALAKRAVLCLDGATGTVLAKLEEFADPSDVLFDSPAEPHP